MQIRAKRPIILGVNVVSKSKLRAFWLEHPDAEEPLITWYKTLSKLSPKNFAELKDTFNSVDLAIKYTIFDVGGNKFRVIVLIDFEYQFAKIRHVLTHKEYENWSAKEEHKQDELEKRQKELTAKKLLKGAREHD